MSLAKQEPKPWILDVLPRICNPVLILFYVGRLECKEGTEPFIKLFRSVDVTGQIVMSALESIRRLLYSSYFPILPDSTIPI